MFLKQYYLGCLSHGSYLIGDETIGQAVVVDPRRDIAEYLTDAAANNLSVTGGDQYPLPRGLRRRSP